MKMGNMVKTRRRRVSDNGVAQSGLSLKANIEQHGQNSLKSRELDGMKSQYEDTTQSLNVYFCLLLFRAQNLSVWILSLVGIEVATSDFGTRTCASFSPAAQDVVHSVNVLVCSVCMLINPHCASTRKLDSCSRRRQRIAMPNQQNCYA
jgi:hypothetical protein